VDTTDTGVILAADPNAGQKSASNMLSVMQQAQDLRIKSQALQNQNALRTLLANPGSYDPTGKLTPQALRGVTAADPKLGMDLHESVLNQQVQKMQAAHYQTEQGKARFDYLTGVAGTAYDAYKAAKAGGASEQDAVAAGVKARNSTVRESGGILSDQDVASVQSQPFDPVQVRALALANKEYAGVEKQGEVLEHQERSEDERERHDLAMEGNARQRIQISLNNQNPAGADYSKDAEDMMAKQFLASGGTVVPKFGYGKKGAQERAQFYNRVAEMAKDEGTSGSDLPTQAAELKADQASLSNITKIADASKAFETTARKNFDTALKLAPKAVPDLGPWVNAWVEKGETVLGNKDVPPYVVSLLTGANEYAKIIAGSTGSQGSTVDSRKEAREMFSPYLNKGQINAVVDVAKKDMDNKVSSYSGQRDEIKTRIANIGKKDQGKSDADKAPPGVPTGSKLVGHTPDGKKEVWQSPDGKNWVQ
jgi:hypothetical protein